MAARHIEKNYITHLPNFYQEILLNAHEALILPADQINLLLVLFFSAAAGSVYRRIKNAAFRHIFGIVVGYLLMWSLYGTQSTLGLLAYIVCMYPVIQYLRQPWFVFWFTMSTLVGSFIYMTWVNYLSWRLDFTTSLMGIVIRLNTLSWDYFDGDRLKKNLPLADRSKVIEYRTEHACIRRITFFEYISYMFFFVHALCGSNLTINEFLQITDRSLFYKNGWKDSKKDPEPTYWDVIYATLQVAGTGIVYLFGMKFFPTWWLTTQDFYRLPTYKRMLIVPFAAFLTKWKYHFGWKCLDLTALTSACAFSGVKYDKDGKFIIQWDRARNINSLGTAFPQYTGDVVNNWNMTVNDWLKNYVFFRVNPSKWMQRFFGGEFGAKVLITRLTSALFHGVYPGYYVFFFTTAFFTNMIDDWRTILPTYEGLMKENKKIFAYIMFGFWVLFVNTLVDSVGLFFMILEIKSVIVLFNHIYWFPYVALLIGVITASIIKPMVKKNKKQDKKTEKNEVKKEL